MKKLFLTFALALTVPMLFTQCSDDKDDETKKPPTDDVEEGVLDPEDFVTFKEIRSFDNTFSNLSDNGKAWTTFCINWESTWRDQECALIKISKEEQQKLMDQAKAKYGKETAIYITDVYCWSSSRGRYTPVVYSGTQTAFTQVSKGQQINSTADQKDAKTWKKVIYPFEDRAVRMTAASDLFVGVLATGLAAESFPFTCIHSDPVYPGRAGAYPSYGFCPTSEQYLQEFNDPTDDRWAWDKGRGSVNTCMEVRLCSIKEYN